MKLNKYAVIIDDTGIQWFGRITIQNNLEVFLQKPWIIEHSKAPMHEVAEKGLGDDKNMRLIRSKVNVWLDIQKIYPASETLVIEMLAKK